MLRIRAFQLQGNHLLFTKKKVQFVEIQSIQTEHKSNNILQLCSLIAEIQKKKLQIFFDKLYLTNYLFYEVIRSSGLQITLECSCSMLLGCVWTFRMGAFQSHEALRFEYPQCPVCDWVAQWLCGPKMCLRTGPRLRSSKLNSPKSPKVYILWCWTFITV